MNDAAWLKKANARWADRLAKLAACKGKREPASARKVWSEGVTWADIHRLEVNAARRLARAATRRSDNRPTLQVVAYVPPPTAKPLPGAEYQVIKRRTTHATRLPAVDGGAYAVGALPGRGVW